MVAQVSMTVKKADTVTDIVYDGVLQGDAWTHWRQDAGNSATPIGMRNRLSARTVVTADGKQARTDYKFVSPILFTDTTTGLIAQNRLFMIKGEVLMPLDTVYSPLAEGVHQGFNLLWNAHFKSVILSASNAT